MMRLLFAMLLLAAAMLIGPVLANHPGYVMLVLGGVTVEATVVGMILSLTVVGCALWLVWWLVKRLFHLPTLSFSFLRSRKERRARQALQQGVLAYARHDWQAAHQAFQIARAEPEWEQLKQVLAAYSAQYAGQPMLANQTAAALDPDDATTWSVVVDLLLLQNNASAAVAYLSPKASLIGKDGQLGRLWLRALQEAGQWQTLLEQVPVAIKQQWFSKADWQTYRFTLYPAAVQGLTEKAQFDEQAAYWQALPARERKSLAVQLGKAAALAVQGLPEQAEKLLLDNLSLQDLPLAWPAVRRIPLCRSVLALRKQTQHWLRDHANHGHLYALLAYCAVQEGEAEQANHAWLKAQQFLPALKAESLPG
jgi:HemY protein